MTKDQQTSHDFDGALAHLKYEMELHGPFSMKDTPLEKQFETIRFALKLAKIVTGEPSEEMITEGFKAKITPAKIFKAMIAQAIREIGE